MSDPEASPVIQSAPGPIWYPAHVELRRADSSVHWVDLAGMRFDEPFFHHTVTRARGRSLITTALDDEPPGEALPAPQPSAFIFHVSRCGSTLLCNLLRAMNGTHVVAEPQPVSALLTPTSESCWPYAEPARESRRDQLLRRMVHRLGQPPALADGRYVLKLSSYCTMRLELLRALWPQVPVIFLVRDPVEVMVSNFRGGSAWLRIWQRPRQARSMFGWAEDSTSMSREEFAARVFGRLCETVLLHKGPRTLVMDYRELIADGWGRIASFLQMPAPDAKEQARIQDAMQTYSKSGDAPARFDADESAKRDGATPAMREAAARWAEPPMRALLAAFDA